MGAQTANAGRVYFPCGTPDPDDVSGGTVDLDASLRRELKEETGLDAGEFDTEPGWYTVFAGPRIAQIRILQAGIDAAELQARVERFLAQQTAPELSGIRMVRGLAELEPAMPDFVTAFLRHIWQ
jgi:8-oxo-dGTP pyrophosphatase MutT (NUDIX family)